MQRGSNIAAVSVVPADKLPRIPQPTSHGFCNTVEPQQFVYFYLKTTFLSFIVPKVFNLNYLV